MITLYDQGVYLLHGTELVPADSAPQLDREAARECFARISPAHSGTE